MLSECYFNLDDATIDHMIASADTDGDGKINEYEFLRIMKKIRLIWNDTFVLVVWLRKNY